MSEDPHISKLKLIPDDHVFRSKLPCPYCGGAISCSAIAWQESDDANGYIATDLEISCDSEPCLDLPEWDDWDRAHGASDYNEKWHALHQRLLAAINHSFRFAA